MLQNRSVFHREYTKRSGGVVLPVYRYISTQETEPLVESLDYSIRLYLDSYFKL
jgi:hypothetical protein